jgi:hypothetical protein
MVKGQQFGRADEGEVERVEEDDRVLALDLSRQIEGFVETVVTHNSDCGEIGRLLTNQYSHDISFA